MASLLESIERNLGQIEQVAASKFACRAIETVVGTLTTCTNAKPGKRELTYSFVYHLDVLIGFSDRFEEPSIEDLVREIRGGRRCI